MRKNFIALFFTMLLVGVVVSCSDNVDFDENQSDEVLNSNISSSDLLMNLVNEKGWGLTIKKIVK